MRVTTDLQPAERFRRRCNRQIHRKHTRTGSRSKNLNESDNRIEGAWNLSVRSTHNLTSQRIFLLWWSSNRETTNSNQRESNRLKQKAWRRRDQTTGINERCSTRTIFTLDRVKHRLTFPIESIVFNHPSTIEHQNRGRRVDCKGEEHKHWSNETGITPVRAAVDTKEAWRRDKSRRSGTEEATATQRQKPAVHRRRRRWECLNRNPVGWTEAGEQKELSLSLLNNL